MFVLENSAPYKINIKEVKLRDLYEDEVLIRVIYTGICGSDIHAFKGLHPFRKHPTVLGHEVVGEVISVGNVNNEHLMNKVVTVNPQVSCELCDHCLIGDVNLCMNRRAPGVSDWNGTMAEYFISPVKTVIELPSNLSLETGVLIEPLAVAYHAIEVANLDSKSKVVIIGVGTIGLLIQSILKENDYSVELVTDIREYPLKVSREFGAKQTLNIAKSERKSFTDKYKSKYDKVFITAEYPDVFKDSLLLLKNNGEIITVSMFNENHTIDISKLQMTEKKIKGCMTYKNHNFEQAVNFLIRNPNFYKDIITEIYPYTKAETAFNKIIYDNDNLIKVLLKF